ncbi:MAG: MarR family winged helix-turn-helix transcriptional regulator [Alphaproteobacteria bacterium]
MRDGGVQTLVRDDALDYGPLRESLGFLIRIGQLKIFEQFYAQVGDLGLRPGEFSVLWLILRNPGVRQGVLAQELLIKPAHMTKLVRGFEDRGFVARVVPDDDRRAVELSLTAAGRDFVEGHKAAFFAVHEHPLSRLTQPEQDELRRLLQKLAGLERGGAA